MTKNQALKAIAWALVDFETKQKLELQDFISHQKKALKHAKETDQKKISIINSLELKGLYTLDKKTLIQVTSFGKSEMSYQILAYRVGPMVGQRKMGPGRVSCPYSWFALGDQDDPDGYKTQKVKQEDLPIYLGWEYKHPAFDTLLKG